MCTEHTTYAKVEKVNFLKFYVYSYFKILRLLEMKINQFFEPLRVSFSQLFPRCQS